MSQPTPSTPSAPTPRRDPTAGTRYMGFFFAPADPTTMAFLRIVVGSLIVYTHLAYSFDLANFFGKDAWYSLANAERERKGLPHFVAPAVWEDPYEPARAAQTPEAPHRRRAVMAYARAHLGPTATPAELDAKLAYLERLQAIEVDQIRRRVADGKITWQGLAYIDGLAADPTDRANQLAVLADEGRRAAMAMTRVPDLPVSVSPDAVALMLPAERATFAREAEAYYATIPADPSEKSIVLKHLAEIDRKSVV